MNLKFSIKVIRTVLGANFVEVKGSFESLLIQNIVIDSRSPLINKQTLFVLFKGNKSHGADFLSEFTNKGGQTILTESLISNSHVNQIVVKDALRALQALAAYHRNQFQIPVIGITGSNGKTTVKEWLYHILKNNYSIIRSPKSYNSQIGVALSVLEMDEGHELAIFEAGISQPGEMVHLEKMIQPTLGIFTGIGDAHNRGFDADNPLVEKKAEKYILFNNVKTLIACQDDCVLVREGEKESLYTRRAAEKRVILKSETQELQFEIPFIERAAVSNSALVYLCASHFGLSDATIVNEMLTLPVISMRLERIVGKSNNTLINDVYSLDEKSLEMGMQYLTQIKAGKPTVLFIAEDPAELNATNSLLGLVQKILEQIPINQVVYIGPSSISSAYTFVNRQYETVSDFLQSPLVIENSAILFTGSRNCHLETAVNYYTEKKHITRLLVNLDGLRHNLNVFRNRLPAETMVLAMVKAQSYGGGMLELAAFLEREKVAYFGVAYADEGVALRKAGIDLPILVMNPEPAAFDDIIDYNLEPSIYSLDLLNRFIHQLILRRKHHFPIHIKLETGMHRLGFGEEKLKELLETLHAQPEVFVKSVFSHLSVADAQEEVEYTQRQIQVFKGMTAIMANALAYPFKRHIANSAGAYHYPDSHFDMVRLGIGLFGLLDDRGAGDFEDVLQLSSQISQIRTVKAGETVGYGRRFIAETEMTIGIVPVGYGDGLRRGLGEGKWSFLIQGAKYPIIGSICMDMCMIDLRGKTFDIGEEVQLFGTGNSVFEMSRVLNTIPYEIISSISARVHRVYISD